MLLIDVDALTAHVQSILDDPHTEAAPTGTPALDAALARLRRRHRAGHALTEAGTLAYWHSAGLNYWHGEGLAYWHGETGPADAHAR